MLACGFQVWVLSLSLKSACRLDDEAEALRCYQDAHRMFPANMDVISWLGAFHVKNEVRLSANPKHKPHGIVSLQTQC